MPLSNSGSTSMSESNPDPSSSTRAAHDKSIVDAQATVAATHETVANTKATIARSRAILGGSDANAAPPPEEARFAALFERCSPLARDILGHLRSRTTINEIVETLEKTPGPLYGGDIEQAFSDVIRKHQGTD